jgi:hypothetical protein
MKPLYTSSQYIDSKSTEKLPCQCYQCDKTFYEKKKHITFELKHNRGRVKFCSQYCNNLFNNPKLNPIVSCSNCKREFEKPRKEIKKSKSGNHFCSRSCSTTYNNKNKSYGTRRSKLEAWLEEQLQVSYTNLEIHYNKKDAINSELDIYIPSLNLAFELNGIFHYEPIFGKDKLKQIQNNDQRKFQACLESNIELVIIDSSGMKYFKPKNAQKYLNIIKEIINNKSKNLLKS